MEEIIKSHSLVTITQLSVAWRYINICNAGLSFVMSCLANLRVIKTQKAVDFNQTFQSRQLLYVPLKELGFYSNRHGGRAGDSLDTNVLLFAYVKKVVTSFARPFPSHTYHVYYILTSMSHEDGFHLLTATYVSRLLHAQVILLTVNYNFHRQT
jgi:hypothetical protein